MKRLTSASPSASVQGRALGLPVPDLRVRQVREVQAFPPRTVPGRRRATRLGELESNWSLGQAGERSRTVTPECTDHLLLCHYYPGSEKNLLLRAVIVLNNGLDSLLNLRVKDLDFKKRRICLTELQ